MRTVMLWAKYPQIICVPLKNYHFIEAKKHGEDQGHGENLPTSCCPPLEEGYQFPDFIMYPSILLGLTR